MIKDRIIESLEYCYKNQKSIDCENCEYGGRSFQICERLVDDILVLLKEQEAIIRCKDCKWYQAGIDINGKPFTRCNGDVRVYGHTKPDWFCADGERRDIDV